MVPFGVRVVGPVSRLLVRRAGWRAMGLGVWSRRRVVPFGVRVVGPVGWGWECRLLKGSPRAQPG